MSAAASPFDTLVPDDLTALVPPEYAAWTPVVRDGLRFFAEHLPPTRQRELAALAVASRDAPVFDRIDALLRACPTLHKLGQVLSRDHRLSPALRERLRLLEVLPPSLSGARFRELLRAELPKSALRDLELDEEPLAEGSVAIVHGFRAGSPTEGAPGVFKLLKPGAAERLEEELGLWPELGAFVAQRCREEGLPDPDIREVAVRVGALLRMEVRLEVEQRNLVAAGDALAGSSVAVPELLPWCTPRLTAMTRLDGEPLDVAAHGAVGRRVVQRLVEALVARPMLQAAGAALFHGDPHAGNLLATPEGRVGVVDWSLVGRLSKEQRVHLVQMILGGMTLDRRRLRRALEKLATGPVDRSAVDAAIGAALRHLRRARAYPGLDWLFALLDDVVLRSGAGFPADLILFRKSMLSLRGVMRELAPRFPPDLAVLRAVVREASREWPRRLRSLPFERGFGTHLSNADLLTLAASGPATIARFWGQTAEAWLSEAAS